MKTVFRFAAIMATLTILAGCATIPEIPYDASTAKVHTIGLPSPAFPNDPQVVLASTLGQQFGLIGAIVDAAMQSNRDSKFEALLAAQHYTARSRFTADLTKALEAKGYKVVPYDVTRLKPKYLSAYPPAPQPVDAYLDVVVSGYGYLAAGIGNSTPYRPYLLVECKLIRASDSTVLMQDSITLNSLYPSKTVITLSPDPAYTFNKFDDLTAAPVKATAGVADAEDKTTDTIGGLLQ